MIEAAQRLAGFRHHFRIVMNEQHGRISKRLDAGCEFSRRPNIVLIAKGDHVRATETGGPHKVRAVTQAFVSAMNADREGGVFGELLCDRHRRVGRCIVGYDEFGRQVLLSRQTVELLANKLFAVARGHRHRYGSHISLMPQININGLQKLSSSYRRIGANFSCVETELCAGRRCESESLEISRRASNITVPSIWRTGALRI